MTRSTRFWIYGSVFFLGLSSANASVSLIDNNGWKLGMGGFIEVDSITDSTRSFSEKVGNAAVSLPTKQAGETGREQMSIRNSRLGFNIEAPEVDGWKTRSYFEFDLMGYDPSPNTVSTGSNGDTEAAFFQNPTFRLRHGFFEGTKEGWQLLAGQTWNLLGWQPYYFMPTVQIQPIPAMLYNRTSQIRGMKTIDMDRSHLQAALGVMRPPQRDSGLPALETGLRWSYDGWSGGFVGGSTPPDKTQPLSVAISGAVREFSVATNVVSPTGDMTHYTGHALAVDALIPVIPSADGKDPSNTLTVGGEFTTGSGDGDQFDSWTGGMTNPLSAGTAPLSNIALDAGIGGLDANNSFSLVQLRTFNVYGQYHLPVNWKTWVSGGWGQLSSDNIGQFIGTTYNKEQVAFGNIMKDMTQQIRLGFEVAQVRTTYNDGTVAHDNRYQLSFFFIF